MGIKRILKNGAKKSKFLSFLFDNIHLLFVEWRRLNVKIHDEELNNKVAIPENICYDDLR